MKRSSSSANRPTGETRRLRFLADESCDFAVVVALRATGHDVVTVADINPGGDDIIVLALARADARVLLTEDKDFGLLGYSGGHDTAGVILIRDPTQARLSLGDAVVQAVSELADRISGAFIVIEPGRARLSRPPRSSDD